MAAAVHLENIPLKVIVNSPEFSRHPRFSFPAAVRTRRATGFDALGVECSPEFLAVIALIADQVRRRSWQVLIHELCAKMIFYLSFREQKDQRLAVFIDDSM